MPITSIMAHDNQRQPLRFEGVPSPLTIGIMACGTQRTIIPAGVAHASWEDPHKAHFTRPKGTVCLDSLGKGRSFRRSRISTIRGLS